MKTKDKPRIYTVTIPQPLHMAVKGIAARNDRSMLAEVEEALWAWVGKQGQAMTNQGSGGKVGLANVND